MLVTLKEILKIAEARGCAIGSFNTPNMASLKAVIAANCATGGCLSRRLSGLIRHIVVVV